MFDKILYYYSKIIMKLQYPSIRDSLIHKTANVGSKSNIIRTNIGRHSYVGNNSSIMDANIKNFCSVASYCAIGGGEHPKHWVSTSPFFYSENKEDNNYFCTGEKVNIGHDVWIGEKVFIKSGVNIGNGAIVGAHSVVTKDVPSYSIVAGCPAKIISYRFDKEKIELLLDINWWDFDDEKLKEYSYLFNNPELFINNYIAESFNSKVRK